MNMSFVLIAAVAKNGVIGNNNTIPWFLATDMKRFKTLTLIKPVIMGRKTWESLRRPLTGRLNIVVTRNRSFEAAGAVIVHSLAEAHRVAKSEAKKKCVDEIFIIGGREIFKQTLSYVDKIYMTEILAFVEGDTFFPKFDLRNWTEISSQIMQIEKDDEHPTRYVVYKRRIPIPDLTTSNKKL